MLLASVLFVVAAATLVGYVVLYNLLVAAANGVDAAWANIDAQLTRRADLVPNLVETVRGYAAHEKETLQAVIDARGAELGASGAGETAAAASAMTAALRQLFALAEAYPQLRANENFLELQKVTAILEDSIAGSRQAYNTAVQDLNTRRETFPSNLVAGSSKKFAAREYFQAGDDVANVPELRFR